MTGQNTADAAPPLVWGAEVKRARLKMGLSIRQLARKLGLKNHKTVWRWEHNLNTPPHEKLQQLANLSGLTLGLQFTPEEEPSGTD